jgi:hypothetical protein
MTVTYDLERLYREQAKRWLDDTIPAVLAWVPTKGQRADRQPFFFDVAVAEEAGGPETEVLLALRWNLAKLKDHEPSIARRAARFRSGDTPLREQVVELAAYGLAFVAISIFLPGRRVVGMRRGLAPDILLDATPGALRGVEVAGRSDGGSAALRSIRVGSPNTLGKARQLAAMPEVAEAYLSLWCSSPRVSALFKVKP